MFGYFLNRRTEVNKHISGSFNEIYKMNLSLRFRWTNKFEIIVVKDNYWRSLRLLLLYTYPGMNNPRFLR